MKNILAFPLRLWRSLPQRAERSVSRSLRDFLPPALEVLEKPPHPAPRALLWLTAAIFLTALAWSILGKADIIAKAEGKIIPGGKVKVVQPLEKGVVRSILASDGQLVRAGQPLVELDQTQNLADRRRIETELDFVRRKQTRREIIAEWLKRPEDFAPTLALAEELAGSDGRDIDARLLYEEWRSFTVDADTLRSQLEERRLELNTSRVTIRQYEATLPLLQTRADTIKHLYEQKVTSRMDYLAVEEERQRQLHAGEAEKSRSEQLAAALESVRRQLAAQRAKGLSDTLAQLDDLSRQRRELEQELAKIRDLGEKMILASPVDGTVKGLAITTVGGVVNEAQVLLEVVPLDERLEVEAFVGNEDIGHVREGQPAEVKIHTFPFTRYGVIPARVESVARDATVDEKLGLIYRARLSLAENSLLVDGVQTPLLPGMAATVEIATGKRRLIEFFLAPLLRAKQESLRER